MVKSTAPKKAGKTESLVESAYRQLKQRILNNDYPPGYQALEPEIAQQLGMSRTPVREALIRLANEGLVEVIPRRGVKVVPLSISDMQEIYQVLTALESEAAALVALRGLTEKQLEPLASAVERMHAALEADELEGWSKADQEFHRALLDLCGNRRLANMAETVMDQVHRARQISLRLRPKPWKSNEEHKAVLEAIRSGDAVGAARIHRDHRENASKVLTGVLQKFQLLHL